MLCLTAILHRVKNWYQNVTFGKCEIYVWSVSIIMGGLKSVLKFHIFLIFNCEESIRIRLISEGLVRFFSDVKNRYQFFAHVKNWYSFFTNMNNQYQILTHVKYWYQMLIHVKNWYQIITDVKNRNLSFTDVNDRFCNI